MKTIRFILFSMTLLGCHHKHPTVKTVEELPDDISNIKVCESLYPRIMDLFPEGRDNKEAYPSLFTNTSQHQIVITKETELYVTFLGEAASKNNALGYYTYILSQQPSAGNYQ